MIIRAASRAPLTTKAQTTFWWMTFWTREDARVILSSHSLPALAFLCFLLPAHKGVILFRGGSWAECGLDPPPVIGAPALGLWIFFSPARLHDGEDKKRNDSDGKGTTQSSGRKEALQPLWLGRERGAWGPGKFPALRSPQPENNFRLAAWRARGYSQQRQVRDRQLIWKPPQRQYLVHRSIVLWKQEENKPVSWSFSWLRYEQRCGSGLPVSSLTGQHQPTEGKQ